MYETYYGLSEKPFNLTPDPRYLFLSEKHREAFAHLLFGIKNRSGFVMVTGEIGTGKTTICRTLLGQLEEDVCLAFIFNPILNSIELLKKILREFGVTPTGTNVLELTEELNAFLLEAAAEGKNCVLVVDEAQNLTPPVLEQIRLLSNLETEREKLIQIILIGQPELGELLSLRELRQLNQRITARYHLKALDETETAQYVAHRMHVAGGRKKQLFDRRAIKLIYKYSGGTPRVINSLCDRSLLIGYTKEKTELDASVVQQALQEIRGEKFTTAQGQPPRWQWLGRLAPSPSLVVLAIAAVLIVQLLSGAIDRLTTQLAQFNTDAPPAIASTGNSPPKAEAMATQPATEAANLPAVPAVNPVTEAHETGIEMWLNDAPGDAARREAVAALLKLWGVDATPAPVGAEADDIRQAFTQRGLALEDFEPSLAALHALNLPALLQLDTAAGPVWAALLRCDKEKATLLIDGTPREVALDTLRAHYVGRALVPWKPDPAFGEGLLRPGMRGAAVAALRAALYAAGKLEEGTGETYDKTVELAVRDLQEETGLIVDGLAGRQVRMVLTSWDANAEAPALEPRSTGRQAPSREQLQTLDELAALLEEPEPQPEIADTAAPAEPTAPDEAAPQTPEADATSARPAETAPEPAAPPEPEVAPEAPPAPEPQPAPAPGASAPPAAAHPEPAVVSAAAAPARAESDQPMVVVQELDEPDPAATSPTPRPVPPSTQPARSNVPLLPQRYNGTGS